MDNLIKEIQNLISALKTQGSHSAKELEHYSIEEAAAIMHCSPNTIRNLIKDDAFKIFKYKGLVRIRKTHLERFISNNTI